MASDDGLVGIVALTFSRHRHLVEDGDDKDCGLAHTRLGLAEDVLSLESQRDGLDLDLTGVLESALSDGSFEFVLEEKLVPTSEIGALVLLVKVFLGLLLVGALILGHDLSHF